MALVWNPPEIAVDNVATYENHAEYATPVHEGAKLANGGVIDGRPWMAKAFLDNKFFDAQSLFAKQFKLSGSFDDAFSTVALAAQLEMITLLRSDVWTWPNETKRKNGEIVGSPRNIVDRGDLLDAQQPVSFHR